MIVSFIGCPGSGKTTLAFKLYASLKERQYPCEFLQEQARMYIAQRRDLWAVEPHEPVSLEDQDQLAIMRSQLWWEEVMLRAVGQSVLLVTDSSPLNSLLYMSPKGREKARFLAEQTVKAGGVTFYCAPVPLSGAADPNRIHDEDASRKVDGEIMPVLAEYAPFVLNSMIYLDGDLEDRFQVALRTVLGVAP